MKNLRIFALVCTLSILTAGTALAEGFALYEWGARGVGLGGATIARTPDPSAVATNPAATTYLEGQQVQAGFTMIKPYGRIRVDDQRLPADKQGSYKLKDAHWFMPAIYYTHQLNDRLTLGVGEYTRFGLGFEYPKKWPGAGILYDVSLVTASVSPTIAYKLTDSLSVGLGVEFMYLDLELSKYTDLSAMGLAGMGIDSTVSGDNVGYGGNMSLHYKLNDQWAFGLNYRLPVQHKVTGEAEFDAPTNFVHPVTGQKPFAQYVDQDVKATVTMPESITFGIAFTPTSDLSIEVGAIWTRWSRFRNFNLKFEDDRINGDLEKRWKNTWRLNVGVEYGLTDWMDVRVGYAWDGCPVTEDNEDYLIPTDGRHVYSLGFGFQFGDLTIDTAYAFIDPRERTFDYRQGSNVYDSKTYSSGTHMGSLSIGYKF